MEQPELQSAPYLNRVSTVIETRTARPTELNCFAESCAAQSRQRSQSWRRRSFYWLYRALCVYGPYRGGVHGVQSVQGRYAFDVNLTERGLPRDWRPAVAGVLPGDLNTCRLYVCIFLVNSDTQFWTREVRAQRPLCKKYEHYRASMWVRFVHLATLPSLRHSVESWTVVLSAFKEKL